MESRGNTHAPRHTCRHAWVSLAVFSRARGGMRMTADARTRKTHACASALLCAQPRTYVRVRVRRAYACAYRHTPTQMLHAHSATHARDGPDSRCSMARRTSSSEPSSAPSRAAAAAAGAQRDRRARARARALKCIARDHRAVQRWRGDARAGADGVARIANAARGGRRGYRPRCAWVHRLALCLPTAPPTRLALRQWHHHGPRVRARRRFGICHGSLSSAEDVQPMIAIGATGPQLAAAAGRRSIVSAAAAGMVRRPGCPRAHIGDVLTAAASSS
jgi:hypothetical protein